MVTKRSHIVLHHTGAEEKNAEQVKAYHIRKGWQDVGYNYVIERSGKLVKGRSLSIPGAHTRADAMNRKSIGIALIGNFEVRGPNDEQIDTLVTLLRELMDEHDLPIKNILPHNKVKGAKTLCPGRHFPLQRILELLPKKNKLWRVQVGAFSSEERAKNYAKTLKKKGIETYIVYP